jgi:hypothetical protein
MEFLERNLSYSAIISEPAFRINRQLNAKRITARHFPLPQPIAVFLKKLARHLQAMQFVGAVVVKEKRNHAFTLGNFSRNVKPPHFLAFPSVIANVSEAKIGDIYAAFLRAAACVPSVYFVRHRFFLRKNAIMPRFLGL